MLDVEKDKFHRRFPNLSGEVDEAMSVALDIPTEEPNSKNATSSLTGSAQKKPIRSFDGYDPTAVDFIRRCGSEKEAQEIIEYMERKREIGRSEAQRMRNQLRTKGLRSFGTKKEYGYYLKSVE